MTNSNSRPQASVNLQQTPSMAGSVAAVSSIESPEFYDLGRIIDPDSPMGVSFAERMQALTERLAGSRYDPTRHRARYLLADDKTINAYTIPSSEPPIIVIHTGLLKDVQSLDEFAGGLAHEWGHIIAQQELGEHRVGKAEEGGADVIAVRLLAEAGMDAKALENMLLRCNEESPPPSRLMQALFDVHPLADNRASAMEKARILLNRSGFTTDNPVTALPEEFKAYARDSNYVSTTDIPARLQAAQYESKSIPEKLEILTKLAQETASYSNQDLKQAVQSHYARQILKTFKEISVTAEPEEVREAYHSTLSKLMRTGLWMGESTIDKFYEVGLKGLGYTIENPWEPIGDFRQLKPAISAFLQADSREAALSSAQRLLIAYEAPFAVESDKTHKEFLGNLGFRGKHRHEFLRHIALGEVTYPSVNEVRDSLARGDRVFVPFERHTKWANEYVESGGFGDDYQQIQQAIGILRKSGSDGGSIIPNHGLNPYARLNPIGDWLANFEVENGEIKSAWPDPVKKPPYPEALRMMIAGVNTPKLGVERSETSIQQRAALEDAMIAHRVQWENEVLQKPILWDLLRSNPRQFFRIYQAVIDPIHTSRPVEHPFADAMIAAIHNQAVLYPNEMTPTHRSTILSMVGSGDILGVPLVNEAAEPDVIKFNVRLGERTVGISQDHPYVLEMLELRRLGDQAPHSEILSSLRVSPYDPIDAVLIPRDVIPNNGSVEDLDGASRSNAPNILKAYWVDDARKQAVAAASADQLIPTIFRLGSLGFVNPRNNEIQAKQKLADNLCELARKSYAIAEKTQDTETLVNWYHEVDLRRSLLGDLPDIRHQWQNTLISRIESITNLAEREALLYKLLETGKFRPASPKLRSQIAELISDTIAGAVGKDDGTTHFQQRTNALLEDYAKSLSSRQGVLFVATLEKLADKIEAQPDYAAHLQRMHHQVVAHAAIKDTLLEGISEVAFEQLKTDPVKRAAILNYTLATDSDSARQNLAQVLTQYFFSHGTRYSHAAQMDVLRKFHAEFWDMPMVARMAVTNDLIFPTGTAPETAHLVTSRMLDRLMGSETNSPIMADDLLGTKDQLARKLKEIDKAYTDYFIKSDNIDILEGVKRAWKSSVQAQVTKLGFLAQTSLSTLSSSVGQAANLVSPDTSPAATARLIVDAYLDTVAAHDPKEAQLLVSALMSAEHERTPGTPMRLGQTLHQVLSHMGPAGAKLLQAIHSHPNTPQDIRDDLKYSKIDHDKPLRWDAIDLARDAGLIDPSKTTHVGPVVGAGSFGITMFNTAPDGVTYADTLLRPRADAIAEREFNFMIKASQIVANADGRMSPVLDMIREGRYSARIETQMSLAAKQNTIAEQVMGGVQVTVGGEDGVERSTTHNVARLVEVGERYKRAEVAQGEHFLSLPESVPMEERRATVLSMAAMQLTQRMAGMPMDRDRHGGNIKVDGSDINHFDFGMTEVTLATDVQKQALGMVIAQAAKDTARGGEFVDHLLVRISKADVSAEARGFLAGFNREILSLGDYFNALPAGATSTNELTGILGHALYGEHTDPVIRAAYESELGAVGRGKAETVFRAAMAESSVTLSNVPRAADLQMPTLAPEEHAIVENRDYGLPHRLATQRNAVQAGVGNGIGVAMGAYGLYSKFNDKDGTFHEDMKSADKVRQAAAVTGVVMDFSNIGAGAVSTAADVKTFQQATVKVPTASAPVSPVQGAPTTAAAAPTAQVAPAATAANSAQASTPPATAPKAAAPTPPAPAATTAPLQGGTNATSATAQAPAPPINAEASGATSAAAAQQAEKAAAETAQAAAKAAEQAAKAEKLLKAGKIAGKAAIPLALATGAVDASAGGRAGDRERVAGAVGSTGGGILGGMALGMAAGAATGAIWGSAVPGVGTIVVGVAAGLVGGIAGAVVGEAAAKHYLSGVMGKLTGADDKFLEAMKQLDPETQKQFAKAGGKLTLDDVHEILKSGKMDSVGHVDTSKDGKLTGAELKAALGKARSVFIENQLTEQLASLEEKGWGKQLGNKDGKLTLDELKVALPKGFDLASLDKDKSGTISGKEITDAIAAAPEKSEESQVNTPQATLRALNPQMRR